MSTTPANPRQVAMAMAKYLKDSGRIPGETRAAIATGFAFSSSMLHEARAITTAEQDGVFLHSLPVKIDTPILGVDGQDNIIELPHRRDRRYFPEVAAHRAPFIELARHNLGGRFTIVEAPATHVPASPDKPVIFVGTLEDPRLPGHYHLGIRIPKESLAEAETFLTEKLQAGHQRMSVAQYSNLDLPARTFTRQP